MEKEEIIEILQDNKENIEEGEWEAVYANIHFIQRNEFSSFLIENDVDPSTLFRDEIPEFAFASCHSLTSITIPNSVTRIGKSAFSRSSLKSVTIPASVTDIDRYAFEGCYRLTSIVIPVSVISIVEDTFRECKLLRSVTIANSVTSIGKHAFDHCKSLRSVTIPTSVTSIGNNAFANCYALKEIKFDGTEAEWNKVNLGKGWISGCPAKVVFLK